MKYNDDTASHKYPPAAINDASGSYGGLTMSWRGSKKTKPAALRTSIHGSGSGHQSKTLSAHITWNLASIVSAISSSETGI
jgi:hypothetical protein